MDIRKLQRAIVDGLEDVKAQDIAVFNTEHLTPLFERVIIASGTSNRQTKALAASVRDTVRGSGFPVMRTEGEENGEWIIVDCGAAVAHIMQPEIRRYYHLEEIWGGKVVKMKFGAPGIGLVKASDGEAALAGPSSGAAGRKSVAKQPTAKAPAARKSGAKSAATPTRSAAPAAKKGATKTPAKTAAKTASRTRAGTPSSGRSAAPAASQGSARKSAAPRAASAEGRQAPARGTGGTGARAASTSSAGRRTASSAGGAAKPARRGAPAKKTARRA